MLPKGLLKEHSRAISMMMRTLDIFTIYFAGVLAYFIRFKTTVMPSSYITAIIIGLIISAVVFTCLNIYTSLRGEGLFKHCISLFQAVFVVILMMACLAFFTKSGGTYSRTWFIIWMVITFFFLILCRCSLLLFLRFMRARGLNERRVVILGAGELGSKFAETVQQALWTGFNIVNFFDDQAHEKPKFIHQIPVFPTPPNLGQYLKETAIDEIWLALPLGAEARVKEILYVLRHHPITTRFVLNIFSLDLLNHSVTEIAGFPVLNIRSSPMIGFNRLVKAVEDRLFALLILLVISPLLALIALTIKLTSKGPILFKQRRMGWDGRVITVYKFRTMVQHQEAEGQVTQATQNDQRITFFGRLLRRTSLDELPQFINVLQGRMSIVGPRPHALPHNEHYKDLVPIYMQRHRVKPGITGWAQVNGWRGETDTLKKMQKRVEYDLYYINNWSFAFDLKIILLTFWRGFINRNAY